MSTNPPAAESSPRPVRGKGPGILFHCAAGATTVFIITVLALVATLFADPEAPVNVWLNNNAAWMLGGEVVLIAVFGIAAMARDQALTAAEQRAERQTLGD